MKNQTRRNIHYSLFIIIFLSLAACSQTEGQRQVTGVRTEAIKVDEALDAIQDTAYLTRLAPYKEVVDREMNVRVGYVPDTFWVGAPECPLLNWLTDALWEAAKQVYPGRVDGAFVNMGSVRGEWLPGDLTFGQIYTIMPFENHLVVITLTGENLIELCDSIVSYGAQGLAGMRMTAVDGQLADVSVGGRAVGPHRTYTLATSDYMTGGADHMTALTRYTKYWDSQLLIRDLYIQAAQRQDTLRATVDGRVTIL